MHSDAFDEFGMPPDQIVTYPELRAGGLTRRAIEWALREGALVRARRNVYLSSAVSPSVVQAQRVGGRLDCVTALAERGVFVLDRPGLHVQVDPSDARLRSPDSRQRRLVHEDHGVAVHWRSVDAPHGAHTVPLLHALAQSVRCQPPRPAIATIDSALNLRLLGAEGLDELFDLLPARYSVLRPHVDGRAEAGSETLARLILKAFGRPIEVQKAIDGVGRVDLVVDGWLVVECDSRGFHAGWSMQESDRERDLALAARGYVTIRPTARLIFERPDVLIAAVRGLLAAHGCR